MNLKITDLYFIAGIFFSISINLICEPIRRKWRKECDFNCKKCKVFDCSKYICEKQKKKYLQKGEQI